MKDSIRSNGEAVDGVRIKEYRTPQGLSATERRMLNGHYYRRCGGGRQVIKKRPQSGNY